MRDDFDAIPDAGGQRDGAGSMLTQIYHDIGLAAVADALDLLRAEFRSGLEPFARAGRVLSASERSVAWADRDSGLSPGFRAISPKRGASDLAPYEEARPARPHGPAPPACRGAAAH